MASYVSPKKNAEYIMYVGLPSQASSTIFKANPTIAAGDFKVSTDGAALGNLGTLPAVTPASSKMVKVTLSAAEMNGDNITLVCSDAAGDEWCDVIVNIQTSARQIDDLAYPTTTGRSIDVTATGAVGIDWGNVENATTAVNLSATNIDTDQVVASVSGAVGSVTGAVASVTGNVGGNVAGSVGSVTGAVGSVTGNVGGNVTGSVGSIATGGIASTSFAANAITAAALAADAGSEVATAVRTELTVELARIDAAVSTRLASASYTAPDNATITAIAGYVDTEVAAILAAVDTEVAAIKAKTDNLPASPAATGDIPSAATIADAVWDEAIAGHAAAGSTGEALSSAGSAGDPWSTALPGAYGAGTAGKIVGDALDAAISSRASQTSLDTLDNYVDTEVAAIKAKTDSLTFTVAGQVDTNIKSVADTTVAGSGTEVDPWGP